MDSRTGELVTLNEGDVVGPQMVPIAESDITTKQKKAGRVSKHDSKSKLGKEFTKARKVMKKSYNELTKNQRRSLKKKTGLR